MDFMNGLINNYLMIIFHGLFFSIYSFILKFHNELAEYETCFFMSLMLYFNIAVLDKLLGGIIYSLPLRAYSLLLFVPITIIICLIYLRKNRIVEIIKIFSNEPPKVRTLRNIVVSIYIVITLVGLIIA